MKSETGNFYENKSVEKINIWLKWGGGGAFSTFHENVGKF
jgi:hypothetical protein